MDLHLRGLAVIEANALNLFQPDGAVSDIEAHVTLLNDAGLLGLVILEPNVSSPRTVGSIPRIEDLSPGSPGKSDFGKWRATIPALDTIWLKENTGLPATIAARVDGTSVAQALHRLLWGGVTCVLLISLLLAALVSAGISRTVNTPLGRIRQRIESAIEEPDRVRQQIRIETMRGEIGQIGAAVNRLMESMAAAYSEIKALARFPSENPNPVMRVSAEGFLLFANESADPICRSWGIGVGDSLPDSQIGLIRAVLNKEDVGEVEERAGSRTYSLLPMLVPDGAYVNIFGRDITESRAARDRIEYLANYDALTGLPNRTLFTDLLKQTLADHRRRKEHFALIVLDLLNFRNVNDVFGENSGDLALIEVARRLTDIARDSDIVARLSGDEFALIQVGLRYPEAAERQAQRIIDGFEEPLDLEGQKIQVGASLGVATYPIDAASPEKLVSNAVLALDEAKQNSLPVYRFYDATLDESVRTIRDLEKDLKDAIHSNQLVLFYQPKIALHSGEVTGAEALIRWQHPDRGMVSPGEFIPVAERSGLISDIGRWALQEACRQFSEFSAQGHPDLSVAVNLSAIQLRDPGFQEVVETGLTQNGFEPARLELEVTESVVMENIDVAIANLEALHALGTKLSIDDFGTGYSSLSQLRKLPLDKIKIDRSFVADIDDDENAASIARTILALGHSLNKTMVAEGIETESQLDFLTDLGCQEGQGFFICRPVPANEFSDFVKSRAIAAE